MSTYVAQWRIEIKADSAEEARRLHLDALAAMDEAPCAVFVFGDGPAPEATVRQEPGRAAAASPGGEAAAR